MKLLFDGIEKKYVDKILLSLETTTQTYEKNTSILNNIKNQNIIGLVIEGYIEVIKTDYNGNKTIIDTIYENDIFGSNISYISNSEYSIITREDTKIIIIFFNDIMTNNLNTPYYNIFLKNLLEIINYKTTKLNERIEILINKTIRNKLLAYFKITSKKNNSRIIYLPYSFTDLADYIGVDRSAMYREINNLKKEGLITIKNKKITLNLYE